MDLNTGFALKGNICYAPEAGRLVVRENACVVCEDGVCRGVFDELPGAFSGLEVIDCGDRLILPGLVDLHTHAPQYPYRGTGMDCELMQWLDRYAFPEEARYADAAYAERAYRIFADTLMKSATARAVVFGTIHTASTLILTDCMEQSGLISYVGKVNMDRNAPPELTEQSAERSAADTRRFIEACAERGYRRTRPILTPRFAPSCTNALSYRSWLSRRRAVAFASPGGTRRYTVGFMVRARLRASSYARFSSVSSSWALRCISASVN